jgi:hypothetical protein
VSSGTLRRTAPTPCLASARHPQNYNDGLTNCPKRAATLWVASGHTVPGARTAACAWGQHGMHVTTVWLCQTLRQAPHPTHMEMPCHCPLEKRRGRHRAPSSPALSACTPSLSWPRSGLAFLRDARPEIRTTILVQRHGHPRRTGRGLRACCWGCAASPRCRPERQRWAQLQTAWTAGSLLRVRNKPTMQAGKAAVGAINTRCITSLTLSDTRRPGPCTAATQAQEHREKHDRRPPWVHLSPFFLTPFSAFLALPPLPLLPRPSLCLPYLAKTCLGCNARPLSPAPLPHSARPVCSQLSPAPSPHNVQDVGEHLHAPSKTCSVQEGGGGGRGRGGVPGASGRQHGELAGMGGGQAV